MLNEVFSERMRRLLAGEEEFNDFSNAVENLEAVKGVRVNALKTRREEFIANTRLELTELPYARNGFILRHADGLGNTPEHHSGMIYAQDPGAMSAVSAVRIEKGWRVLDACAAPGGKSGQAAAEIGDGGFLHANEFVPKRAKTLVSNLERLGVKNAVVTSLDTANLPLMYRAFFDLVIADVPCSGEGMFRKSAESLAEWSEENVIGCAARQSKIIRNLAPTVRPGGYLLYSTCTYSLEENEMNVDAFLRENPDFSLVEVTDELKNVTRDGIAFDGAYCDVLNRCRRFYPHVAQGEGQFVALMKRGESTSEMPTVLYRSAFSRPSREEMKAVSKFFEDALLSPPDAETVKIGERIALLPRGIPVPPKSVFMAGVLLGSAEKGLLFPSHQFFSAYGRLFKRQENLTRGDARLEKYLRGEEIAAENVTDSGWCAVLFEGAALGGGKASAGRIKNHYPKGLRNK